MQKLFRVWDREKILPLPLINFNPSELPCLGQNKRLDGSFLYSSMAILRTMVLLKTLRKINNVGDVLNLAFLKNVRSLELGKV